MIRSLKSKRAQEGGSMIGLIVTIALILIAALFLILFFTRGSGSFGDFLNNLIGKGSNTDAVISGCNNACNSNSKEAYCSEERTLRFNDKTSYKGTCYLFQSMPKLQILGMSTCEKEAGECSAFVGGYKLCTVQNGEWKESCEKDELISDIKFNTDKKEAYETWVKEKFCCSGVESASCNIICLADKCPAANRLNGPFTPALEEGRVCCNVACTS
jgi:hypothetical protein